METRQIKWSSILEYPEKHADKFEHDVVNQKTLQILETKTTKESKEILYKDDWLDIQNGLEKNKVSQEDIVTMLPQEHEESE